MEFFATCPAGFERLLARELQQMGTQQVRPLKGQVSFAGSLKDAYRACLWSHLASRVVVPLARGDARDANALYQTASSIDWENQLVSGASFAVDAHGTNSHLRDTQFVALRVKDAILDRLLARTGKRAQTDTARPDLRIVVRIMRERCVIGIDLTGEPLFRRGYEAAYGAVKGMVPLRPDYAAALMCMGGWQQICASDTPALVAPFSGAGSIAVEAAMMAKDRAPGLLRQRWGFAGWALHDALAWEDLLTEARERCDTGAARPLSLLLSDTRAGFERAARQALGAAGLDVDPQFFAAGDAPASPTSALLACDLAWTGEQAAATKAAALKHAAQSISKLDEQAHASLLSPDATPQQLFGEPSQTETVFLGRDEAQLLAYDKQPRVSLTEIALPTGGRAYALLPSSSQFASRLTKVARQRRKWARREDITCYRIYDSDLPDYAVSIDLFEGIGGKGRWLQIFEYAPPKEVDPARAQLRLLDVATLAPAILDVRPQDTFVRVRTKAKGGSQYASEAQEVKAGTQRRGKPGSPALPPGAHLVDEGGLTFEVNFSMRLDCGIFLDHRDTRAMLREMTKRTRGSKRFLNLFAYTGTGTCYAADGGAKFTTTVDLSRPSLDWAKRNMERNGFTGPEHEYVQEDVIAWVSKQRRTKNRWDLIFCDVPTFSNSQRMRSSSFDVQRDHAELLIGVSRLLTRDGTCVFSCNLRTFKIDEQALAKAGVEVEDITAQTIPEDFARNPRIHKCYLVRRVAVASTSK